MGKIDDNLKINASISLRITCTKSNLVRENFWSILLTYRAISTANLFLEGYTIWHQRCYYLGCLLHVKGRIDFENTAAFCQKISEKNEGWGDMLNIPKVEYLGERTTKNHEEGPAVEWRPSNEEHPPKAINKHYRINLVYYSVHSKRRSVGPPSRIPQSYKPYMDAPFA